MDDVPSVCGLIKNALMNAQTKTVADKACSIIPFVMTCLPKFIRNVGETDESHQSSTERDTDKFFTLRVI